MIEVCGYILGGSIVVGAASLFIARFMKVGKGPTPRQCNRFCPCAVDCRRGRSLPRR